ncbi:flippase-like domain-containing protein [Frankia sp. AiPa1]|nr:flippase-like domain-containing protein [Frankia sp. AiPa1]
MNKLDKLDELGSLDDVDDDVPPASTDEAAPALTGETPPGPTGGALPAHAGEAPPAPPSERTPEPPGAGKSEAAQSEAAQSEAARSEAARTEAARTGSVGGRSRRVGATAGRFRTDVVPGGLAWGRIAGRVVPLAITAVAIYLLAPQLLTVFSAFPRLRNFRPLWYPAMVALEIASFACVWQLQRLAIDGLGWFLSITSQLASNSISRIIPGGIAVGGAVQFRMLSRAGCDPVSAGFALTAVSMVTTSIVFSLPLFVLPALIFGQPAPHDLTTAAWLGGVVFAVLAVIGLVLARSDGAVRLLARLLARLARLARRPIDAELADLLLIRRDEVLRSLGRRLPAAVLVAAGKWGLDYLALLAALAGAGQHPRASLVLLAYVAASVLAMIPITPGGLGFVEAGLTGTLALAGVPPAAAALSTLAYRLVSFWLPLAAGAPAWIAYRVRYR